MMTNAYAILIGFGMIAAAVMLSNVTLPADAQSSATIIPPVEALVPNGEAGGTSGPWHLWRMNRHTGQVSFCTAEIAVGSTGQSAASGQLPQPMVACTKTSPAM